SRQLPFPHVILSGADARSSVNHRVQGERMTKDIVGKLREFLAKPVDTESSVVYLMAQVRKLLDRDDPTYRYGALRMYCHWALHVDLRFPNTTMGFLRRVDLWVTNTVAYLTPSGPSTFLDEVHLFREFTYLSQLRTDLGRFLGRYDLPTELCDDDPK